MKIADVARDTGLNRSTISSLYREDASRIDLESIDRLCRLFHCQVGDLLEFIDDSAPGP